MRRFELTIPAQSRGPSSVHDRIRNYIAIRRHASAHFRHASDSAGSDRDASRVSRTLPRTHHTRQ